MSDPTPGLAAPRAASTLFGHEAAERTLLDAARSGRMPHAWLFGGPPGIGKATLAFRFARYLLAGAPPGASLFVPTDHRVSRQIASGGHPDLLTVERAIRKEDQNKGEEERRRKVRDLGIDEVRRIDPFLRLTSAQDGWRVVVVDEAEEMNRSSANALLKVLEEPPSRAVLILVSANPGALLPTIRSRCRRLMLDPLPDDAVAAALALAAPDVPAEDRAAIVRLAEGSIGRAVALAEEDGLALYRDLVRLLDGLPRLDILGVHRLADRVGLASAEPAWRLVSELLPWWMARLARAAARGVEPPEIVAGEGATLRRIAATGLDRWLEVWENTRLLFAQADESNLDRKQVLLQAFLSMERACRA